MVAKRNRSSSSRKKPIRKPTTIDAKATEVINETSKDAAKTSLTDQKTEAVAKSSTSSFGRNAGSDEKAASASDAKSNSANQSSKKSTSSTSSTSAKSSAGSTNASTSMTNKSSGGGFGLALMSALLGSVVTVGGLGLVGQTGSANSLPLIGPLFAGSGNQAQDIGAFKTGLSKVREEAAAYSDKFDEGLGGVDAGLKGLGEKVATVETAQGGFAKLDVAEANQKRAEDLLAKLSQTETKLGEETAKAAETAAKIEEISVRIAALEEETQRHAEALPNFDTLKTGVAGTQAAVTAARKKDSETELALATLTARLDALEGTVTTDLSAKLETVSKAAESASASEKVAKAVSLSAIQAASERGASYLSGLASYETLVGETEDTKRLKELAGQGGMVNVNQLAEEFGPLSSKMLAELSPVSSENSSLVERLMGSAKSLVTIRSTGPVEGESPKAVISRIKSSLEKGNLEAVVTEWDGLPDAAKSVGEGFLGKVKARMEAQGLIDKLLGQTSLKG